MAIDRCTSNTSWKGIYQGSLIIATAANGQADKADKPCKDKGQHKCVRVSIIHMPQNKYRDPPRPLGIPFHLWEILPKDPNAPPALWRNMPGNSAVKLAIYTPWFMALLVKIMEFKTIGF